MDSQHSTDELLLNQAGYTTIHPRIQFLLNQLEEDEVVCLADGYEDAILGLCESPSLAEPVVAYDYDKCIEILMDRDGMSYEDAVDFFNFNTLGSYIGPQTPLYITVYREKE